MHNNRMGFLTFSREKFSSCRNMKGGTSEMQSATLPLLDVNQRKIKSGLLCFFAQNSNLFFLFLISVVHTSKANESTKGNITGKKFMKLGKSCFKVVEQP